MVGKKEMHLQEVSIPVGNIMLEGSLHIPEEAHGIVLFAHGSGSSRLSPRNQFVARFLHDAQIATLLFDLLTPEEEVIDDKTRELRFNISFLAKRLQLANRLGFQVRDYQKLIFGILRSEYGAAAALIAAAELGSRIKAVVSRGGRPILLDKLY